jgi:hypothetical protein
MLGVSVLPLSVIVLLEFRTFQWYNKPIRGEIVSVLASSVVDNEFEDRAGQTKR